MAAFKYTPIGQIKGIVDEARATFATGKTRDLAWRKAQLKQVAKMIEENTDAITEALKADLRRPDFECVRASLVKCTECRHRRDRLT